MVTTAFNLYHKMVKYLLPTIHKWATDTNQKYYQINAGGEVTAPTPRKAKRGYTVVFSITKLDIWLNPGDETLPPEDYPILMVLNTKHIAVMRDTTNYYIPPTTRFNSLK